MLTYLSLNSLALRGDVERAMNVFDIAKKSFSEKRVILTSLASSLMEALSHNGWVDEATKFFEFMTNENYVSFDALRHYLQVLEEAGQFETLNSVAFRQKYLDNQRLTPEERRELIIWRIRARCGLNDMDSALNALNTLTSPVTNKDMAPPNHEAFAPIIEGFVRNNLTDRAEEIVKEAAKYGLDRNDVLFHNAYIAGFAKDYERAMAYV